MRDSDSAERILFVDDDPFVLDGLRDALRPHRRTWSMSFVTSGEEALAALDREPHAVIVSDLRMPGMDGAGLLEETRDRHPGVVRVVLSGQAELDMAARAAGTAHRMIAKPCETDDLVRIIRSTCATRRLTHQRASGREAAGASVLPSVPHLYAEMTTLLSRPDATISEAAQIVQRDIGMTTKVLQLANSAYFGRRCAVSRVSDAVAYVGLEALRALVLEAEVFRAFPVGADIPGFDVEVLHAHCMRVARLASAITTDPATRPEIFTAALLHDVGLLIRASHDSAGLREALHTARHQRRPLHEVEREHDGATNAELGAHLLTLWGLPPTVTEAVASHHEPVSHDAAFGTAAILYTANVLVEECEAAHLTEALPASEFNPDYIGCLEPQRHLADWRRLAVSQLDESG